MSRIERKRRTQCALRCEILGHGRKPVEARIVSLSEGGLCVVAPMRIEEGDTIALRMMGPRRKPAITLTGLVWNGTPARGSLARAGFWQMGCVLSDPPPFYQQLVDRMESNSAPLLERRISTHVVPRTDAPGSERDLPLVREQGPPPKPDPHETLPTFRVRLKQLEGPRSRSVAVRARSVGEAESIARSQLGAGGAQWELVEVSLAS
jgi:hypothetical protein